jgi:RHS repeat-associated protein
VFGQPKITDAAGTVVRPYSYYSHDFLFQGREYIRELGIYDYRHRFYHPGLGRFIQTDPTGFDAGDMNLFRYCGDNSINLSDPMGLLAGFGRYELVPDNHPLDDTHDGYKIGGVRGTEIEPGAPGVHLEVDRNVRSVERIGSSDKGADTHTTYDANNKDGQPTIHAQIDVRYATGARQITRDKSLGSEWQHSNDAVKDANHIREVYASRVGGLSGDAATALIRNGDRRGPQNTWTGPLKGPMSYEFKTFRDSFNKWDAPVLRSPNGEPLSRHSPVDQNGEPVPWSR